MSICTDPACPLSCDNINSRPGVNTVDSVTSNAVQSWKILYVENTQILCSSFMNTLETLG